MEYATYLYDTVKVETQLNILQTQDSSYYTKTRDVHQVHPYKYTTDYKQLLDEAERDIKIYPDRGQSNLPKRS